MSTPSSRCSPMLSTVGGALEHQGLAGDLVVLLAVWAAALLKLLAAVLPLVAVSPLTSPPWQRTARILAWIEAVILSVYGLVLTVVGVCVQAGVIDASAGADRRALAWHAYLWDPWFLILGLLVAAALRRGHRARRFLGQGLTGRRSPP